MVVLSKLATDFINLLDLKINPWTTGINFTKYVLQATANKYKTEEDFKRFLEPKISNLSSLGIDINDKKSNNTFKTKGRKMQKKLKKK